MLRITLLKGDSKQKKERKKTYRVNIIYAHERLIPHKMTTTLYQIQREKKIILLYFPFTQVQFQLDFMFVVVIFFFLTVICKSSSNH